MAPGAHKLGHRRPDPHRAGISTCKPRRFRVPSAAALLTGAQRAHAWLRREVPALEADRYLHPDILAAAHLVLLAECIQIDL